MFINETGSLGLIVNYATLEVTGSLFLTLLGVVMILLLLCFLLRIPIEFSAILILPLMLGLMSYFQEFVAIGGVFLIYLGIVLGKNFFFR